MARLATAVEIVSAEKVNVTEVFYERTAGIIAVHRSEAMLVTLYRESLGVAGAHRLWSAVGHTDLYRSEREEIIEAKRGTDHRYVREALGQLLDYAVNVTVPVKRLTALFPARPSDPDLALLHVYGVDCVHWITDLEFRSLPASDQARQRMQPM